MKRFFLFVMLGIASVYVAKAQWNVQPAGSSVTFKIKNAGITVDGKFSSFTATAIFDPTKLSEARLTGTVQTKTIDTGIKGRDNHLRKEEYFYAEKYPTMLFNSTSVTQKGNGYVAKGNLTIKDVTRVVEIPFLFQRSGSSATLIGQLQLDRRDYHVGGNSWVMGDKVDITITLKLTQ